AGVVGVDVGLGADLGRVGVRLAAGVLRVVVGLGARLGRLGLSPSLQLVDARLGLLAQPLELLAGRVLHGLDAGLGVHAQLLGGRVRLVVRLLRRRVQLAGLGVQRLDLAAQRGHVLLGGHARGVGVALAL